MRGRLSHLGLIACVAIAILGLIGQSNAIEVAATGEGCRQHWYNFSGVRFDWRPYPIRGITRFIYDDISGRVCGQDGLGTWEIHGTTTNYIDPSNTGTWRACVPVVKRGVPGADAATGRLRVTILDGAPLRLRIEMNVAGSQAATVPIRQGSIVFPTDGPLGGIRFGAEIVAAAARHKLDPSLLAAIAAQETGGPPFDSGQNIMGDCTPNCHGYGVFQIDDRSHSDFTDTSQAMNPADNAEYAADMMEDLLAKYGSDVHKALSAYNSGRSNRCGTKTSWKANGDVLCYADSVLRHQERLKERLKSKKVGGCQ